MTVKGSATVTLTQYRDTQSVTRYYKLQTAGSSAPSKPTTKPPSSDWTDSEPACDISKELYFCDLTIFSNGEGEYSTVSKSSSYEAAKEAYHKAQTAQADATAAQTNIDLINKTGAGGNLIKNGYGELLDNTNFKPATFTRGDCPDGCYGYFNGDGYTEIFPFNPNIAYKYDYYVRLHDGKTGSNYFSIHPFDIDGNLIQYGHVLNYNQNLFYLSQDLNDGDTVVHFTDLTYWKTNTTQSYQRSFLIFGYTDGTGYTYPDGTYSRNRYSGIYTDNSSVDKTNNTITLSSAWKGGTIIAGTCIGQSGAGDQYCYYGQIGAITNTDWVRKTGEIYAGDLGGREIDKYSRRLLYAKSIRVSLWNNVADYAKIYIGEEVIDNEARKSVDDVTGNIYAPGSTLLDGSKISDGSLSINQMDDTVAGSYSDPTTKKGVMEWKNDALHIKSVDANAQNTYETVIGGDGIKFNWNGAETASINQDELRINKTVVINAMEVGNWSWAIHPTTGNLMVKWNGGDS